MVESLKVKIPYFKDEAQIREIKSSKIIVRSSLGIQNPDLWINHLNIGNVMNLNPMMSDELINKNKTDPESSMTMETLLENCVLYIVSAFCMATELRLLY